VTTAESTRAKRVDRKPDLGFKNPTNWIIGPVAGAALATGVALGARAGVLPYWLTYVVVAVVALWVVAYSVDQSKRRKAAAK
jgi:hypothetical protein